MASFASLQVARLQTALATGAAVVSINVDGVATTFDRDQALRELRFWERQAAQENGTRPSVAQVKMSGF